MPLNVQGADIRNVNAVIAQNWKIDGEGKLVVKHIDMRGAFDRMVVGM